MYILANPDNSIQYIGIVDTPGAVVVEDSLLPADLNNTFALGKYTLVNGAIVETPNWVAPVMPTDPTVIEGEVIPE